MANALDPRNDALHRFEDSRPARADAGAGGSDRIAAFSGKHPLYTLPNAWGARLSAARWKFEGQTTLRPCALQEIVLGCRAGGSATIVRSIDEGSMRKRPVLGAVSLMNPSQNAEWLIDGGCDVMHVYIPRTALQEFTRKSFGSDLSERLREFVGVRDPWLTAYFQMLTCEAEQAARDVDGADPLFLAETEAMLMRHLIEFHSDADRGDLKAFESGRRIAPLRSAVLRRVKDYVEVNLASEIHLGDLAAVACMSDDHFLRSFRAACGTTPYQYVIQKRVEAACRLLEHTGTRISRIALDCGFKNAAQLSLRFRAATGVSPSRYRATART